MLYKINKNDTNQKSHLMFTGEQNQFYIVTVALSIYVIQKKQIKRKLEIYTVCWGIATLPSSQDNEKSPKQKNQFGDFCSLKLKVIKHEF